MGKSHPKGSRSSMSHGEYSRPSLAVADFVAALVHPHKSDLLAVREVILSASPDIQEGIKWNAPSFWCGEWFASFHLRAKPGVMLVLHRGAKKQTAPSGTLVDDPEGLLCWITQDRCTVSFSDASDLKKKSKAFRTIIREWSRRVAFESKKG